MRSSEPDAFRVAVNKRNWDGQGADMRSTLMTWDWRWATASRHKRVQLDFSNVEFMEPWALAMFACFGLNLCCSGVSVEICVDSANPSNVYFEQMGLRHIAERAVNGPKSDRPQDTGLAIVRTMREAEMFAECSGNLLREVDAEIADRVKYCVGEFGRNVVQHAESPAGAVAIAQRFPDAKAVQIVLCDAGRGVMNSLRPYYPELQTDLESLRLATLPHTSGAAPPRPYGQIENMGLGLFFSKEIAWRSGGSFWLASGKGLLGLTASDENGPRRVYRTINPWPGTLAVIHLPDRASSDFADVLAVCHKLAMQFQSDATVGALEFVDASAELPDDAERIAIAPIQDDLAATHQLRTERLLPSLASGRMVALEFENVRFLSTSVGQALLSDAFRTRGSLTRLVFRNCTRATELAIRTIAAFAKAGYKRRPE